MIRIKILVLIFLFAAIAVVLSCAGYKYTGIKPEIGFLSEEEKNLYGFISRNLTAKNQGIITNYSGKPAVGDLPGGKDILSESLGLMMHYALEVESRSLFEKQYLFLEEVFITGNSLVIWKVDENNKHLSASNAVVDDLRICGALISAYEKWGEKKYLNKALKIADGIRKYNTRDSMLVDYYDCKKMQAADVLTLAYIDLDAMNRLAAYDNKWRNIYTTSCVILNGGLAGEQGVFFHKRYNVLKKIYESDNTVNMAEQAVILENLLRAGIKPSNTLKWIKDYYGLYGYIVNDYEILTGSKANNNESISVYALLRRVFLMAGDVETAEKFNRKIMKYYLVANADSRFFGGYYMATTGESCSFDNLQALISERYKNNLEKARE